MNCRFWNAGSETQQMGHFPECRVEAGEAAFIAAGVDLMGAINVKHGRSLVKRCVVCLSVWHQELSI